MHNEYYYKNREYILVRQKLWQAKNREKYTKYNIQYWANKLRFKRNKIINHNKLESENKIIKENKTEWTNQIVVLFN
jgi:hypothetical protein